MLLLELGTLLVVRSHTKNKIGNSFYLRVTLIEYSFDEICIFGSKIDLINRLNRFKSP